MHKGHSLGEGVRQPTVNPHMLKPIMRGTSGYVDHKVNTTSTPRETETLVLYNEEKEKLTLATESIGPNSHCVA